MKTTIVMALAVVSAVAFGYSFSADFSVEGAEMVDSIIEG